MLNAWTVVAEQLIRAAQDEGKFDNLPGFGQPIPGIDEPHDEYWWIKAKLKREQLSVAGPLLDDPPRRHRLLAGTKLGPGALRAQDR